MNEMKFDSAMYYMFSTIAQTLAGALALLGAFVLYKLQIISKDADWCVSGLSHSSAAAVQDAIKTGDYDKIIEAGDKGVGGYSIGGPGPMTRGDEFLASLKEANAYRKKFLRDFRGIVVWSGIVVGLSFLALDVTPWIAGYPNLAIACLVVGMVLVGSCLVLIVRFLVDAVSS